MAWNVEQQTKSGLGQLVWLKVAGPFNTEAEATMIADRMNGRTGLPSRIVAAPCPPADALDRLLDGRPCRIIERPRQPSRGTLNHVTIEFADGSRHTASIFDLKRAQ